MPKAVLPVSATILTKNEEANIEQCIRHLCDFDEIYVVDSQSTDDTVRLAKSLGVQVVQFQWDGKYPKKKQWQLDNIEFRNNWVLMLDADEYPSPELVESIRGFFKRPDSSVAAFDIGLTYWFAGRELKHGHRVVKRALLDRRRCQFPEVDDLHLPGVGEVEGHYQPEVHGRVSGLVGSIVHRDRDPVRSWFDRHNRYSDWEANLLQDDASKKKVGASRSRQGRLFAKVPAKAVIFFVYSYILKRGFLDGRSGFDYAVALSFYYWQIGVKHRELTRSGSANVPRGN